MAQKNFENKLIKAIVGFRRSGKSYLLKMFAEYLLTQKIPHENIFYLNFENDLLIGIKTVQDLRRVWELYLSKIAILDQPIFIIWDEVQLVNNWEKLVRTLYETEQYNIYLSGSNSQLLSGEFASSLSGRAVELRVQPFSFVEYLDYLELDYSNYYDNKARIDFVVKQGDRSLFYQVCLELIENNLAREAGNLKLIQKYQSCVAELLVLNNYCQDTSRFESLKITSVIEWLTTI